MLVQACPGKSVVGWTDRPAMTIAVDLGRKATKQTKSFADSRRAVVSYKRKYVHKVLVNRLNWACPGKSVVRLTECLHMTIVVDWDIKSQNEIFTKMREWNFTTWGSFPYLPN